MASGENRRDDDQLSPKSVRGPCPSLPRAKKEVDHSIQNGRCTKLETNPVGGPLEENEEIHVAECAGEKKRFRDDFKK